MSLETNTEKNPNNHITIGCAAAYLGISIDTVRRWERDGKINAYRINGRNRYFSVVELAALKADKTLAVGEVAKLLGVSTSTVRRLETRGILKPSTSKSAKQRRYTLSSVENYQSGTKDLVKNLHQPKVVVHIPKYVPNNKTPNEIITPAVHSVISASIHKARESNADLIHAGSLSVSDVEPHTLSSHRTNKAVRNNKRRTTSLYQRAEQVVQMYRSPHFAPIALLAFVSIAVLYLFTVNTNITSASQAAKRGASVRVSQTSAANSGAVKLSLPSTFFLQPDSMGLAISPTMQLTSSAYAQLPVSSNELALGAVGTEQLANDAITIEKLSKEVIRFINSREGGDTINTTIRETVTSSQQQQSINILAGLGLISNRSGNEITLSFNPGATTYVTNGAVEVKLSPGVVTGTTASATGLESTASGLQLIGGCGTGQILQWTGAAWSCTTQSGGGGGNLAVLEGGTTVTPNASALDFTSTDFTIVDNAGQAQVSIDYANSGLAQVAGTATVTGNWRFNDTSFALQDDGDATKQVNFQLSGVGTGTTRTLTVPNASGTIITTGNLTGITSVGTITVGTWQGSNVGVQYGGTGATSFTSNGLVYGNGSGALQVTAAGTAGQIPVANGGAPTFVSLSGDATLNGTGVLTIANGVVSNAKLANSALTVSAGTGLSGGGAISLGGSGSLSVAYGSSAGTAAQGNTAFTFTGSGNLTGALSGSAGAGFTTTTLALSNSPVFSTSVGTPMVTNAGNLSISTTTASKNITINPTGSLVLQINGAALNCSGFDNGGVLTTNASGVVSCANDDGGAGGSVTGSGTIGALPMYTGASAIGDSPLSVNGSALELANTYDLSLLGGDFSVQGAGNFSGNVTVGGSLLTGAAARIDSSGVLQNVSGAAANGVGFNADVISNGSLNDARLSTNVTLVGNTFNGNSQLIQTTAAGLFPALDGSLISLVNAASLNGQAASYYLAAGNLTGSLNDARLSTNVTLQGNTFNGNSQLIQTTASGRFPALDGSLITDINANTLSGQAGSYYSNAGNLTGSLNDARLSTNVTVQGNSFNGNSQLVQLNASSQYPALDGSLITGISASTLNGQSGSYYSNAANLTGTLSDSRLSTNVTVQGNAFNGNSQLIQTTAAGRFPALDGSLISLVNAASLNGQAASYYLDAGNLTGSLNDNRLSTNVTVQGNSFNGNSQLVQLNASSQYPALDGSLITGITASTLNGQSGSYYLDAANLTGSINDARLSTNVTVQGNTFNGNSQLVQTTVAGRYPGLDGSLISLVNAASLNGQAGSYYSDAANLTGSLNDARLSTNVTVQGNTFNGNSQLIQATSGGKYPALDGSLITDINAVSLNGQSGSYYSDAGNLTGSINDARLSTNVTVQGNSFNGNAQLIQTTAAGRFPALDGSLISLVNAASLNGQAASYYLAAGNLTGSINDARLSTNVTVQGNTFNGNSQLIQATSGGKYPALDGSLVTDINAITLNGQAGSYYSDAGNLTGSLNDARLSTNVTRQGNTFNGNAQLIQTTAAGRFPALDGSLISLVNAASLNGQAASYYLDAANFTGSLNDARLSTNVTQQGNTFNGNSQLVKLNASGQLPAIDGSQLSDVSVTAANFSGTLSAAKGGTGINTSGSTGIATVSAGTWSIATSLGATMGGTGQTTTTTGDLLVGAAGNSWTKVSAVATGSVLLSAGVGAAPTWGQITNTQIANNTITATQITNNTITNTQLASGAFSNITGVGTLSSGTWQATAIGAAYGGTGVDSSGQTGIATVTAGAWSFATSLSDAQISNTLTASNFVGSGSSSNAVDLATAEIAGNLLATNLQNAAADLGAANVTVNLSNTNGAFNTNLTIDGALSVGSVNANSGGITNAGSIGGVAGLTLTSGNISGAGTVNGATITSTAFNGLSVSGGALSAVAGITFTSGALALNSGGITAAGTIAGVTGVTFTSGALNIANGGITSAGAISGATTISANDTITTTKTNGTALSISGTNVAPSGQNNSVIQVGAPISGTAAAGTYFSINQAASGTSDFLNFKINDAASRLRVDSTGAVIAAGGYSSNGSSGSTISACAAGSFIGSAAVVGGLITAGSCTSTSLQGAYNNDASGEADILTTSGTKTFVIQAGATFDSTTLFHVKNAAGTDLLSVDSSNNRIQIGGTGYSTPTLLVLSGGTSDPTYVAGAIYYNSTSASFRCAQAGAWRDCLGALTVSMPSDQAVTNSATFTNATNLAFPVAAGAYYTFTGSINMNMPNTTADGKYTFTVPTGSTVYIASEYITAATTSTNCNITASGQVCAIAITAALRTNLKITGYVAVGGTAGNVQFQFAQNAATAGQSVTVYTGSSLTYQRTE